MATYTTHYNLKKPEPTDTSEIITDLNTNYDTIDTALYGKADTTHASTHKGDGTDAIDTATTTVSGLMSSTDKKKLDDATAEDTASALVIRDVNKRAKFADPVDDQDVATKKYVDSKEVFINVKDFGAKGDGTTDDTEAIQSALDSVPTTGAVIFFPAGLYVVTEPLIFPYASGINVKAITIKGEPCAYTSGSMGSYTQGITAFKYSGVGALFDLRGGVDDESTASLCYFEDFIVHAVGDDDTNGIGISAYKFTSSQVRNVVMKGLKVGIKIANYLYYCVFDTVRFFYCTDGLVTEGAWNGTTIFRGNASSCTRGYNLTTSGVGVNIFGVWFENNDVGIYTDNHNELNIDNCYFERNKISIQCNRSWLGTNYNPKLNVDKCYIRASGDATANIEVEGRTYVTLMNNVFSAGTGAESVPIINGVVYSNTYPIVSYINNAHYAFIPTNVYAGMFTLAPDTATFMDLTYYVDATGGDDTNDGTSAKPFKTITRALRSIPPIVNHNVTINIADGTYDETMPLMGFSGKGTITIQGNNSNPGNVVVTGRISIYRNTIRIDVQGIRTTKTGSIGLYCYENPGLIFVRYFICDGADTSNIGALFRACPNVWLGNSTFSNRASGITADYCSQVRSYTNSGSGNVVGLTAISATIMKDSTQPGGTTAESTSGGGIIR